MQFVRASLCLLFLSPSLLAERPKFSGPQPGEVVTPFRAKAVFGEDAGKEVTVMGDPDAAGSGLSLAQKPNEQLDGKPDDVPGHPSLLIFVHQLNRPAIGLSRVLVDFANSKKKAGLHTDVVFLTDDRTETEAWMKRARGALPKVRALVSVDGIEGPGSYGLNRLMTLTVLVVKDGKVTENFALTQPSINVDAPKIGHAILKVLKDPPTDPPTLKEMGVADARRGAGRMMKMSPEQNDKYRSMMAPVIRGKTPEDVDKAAKAVEEFAAKTPWFKNKVGSAASMIVGGGKLSNYGNETAQAYLKKWSVAYKPKDMKKTAEGSKKDADAVPKKVESKNAEVE